MRMDTIIRAAIPDASSELCEYVLWERTPFPVGAITARSLYKAADRFRRANEHGIELCTFCDHPARHGGVMPTCEICNEIFSKDEGKA